MISIPIAVLTSCVLLVAGVLFGWMVAAGRERAKLAGIAGERTHLASERARLERELSTLRERLESEQRRVAATDARLEESLRVGSFLEGSVKQLENAFAALSQKTLSTVSSDFLTIAKTQLDGTKGEIATTLDAKRTEIESLLQPVREMLQTYKAEVAASEQTRREAYGGLQEQIKQLLAAQQSSERETAKLANALRVPNVRGAWGETTLRNCVELAGMTEYVDFDVQATFETDEGKRVRPDLVVRLPNNRVIAVDSKAPIDAYLEAASEADEGRKRELLAAHAKNLRRHVDQLSKRDYQSSVGETLDFTVLFLGGEQFLSSALLTDPSLFEYATGRKVYLASPTVLLPLLRAVAAGWKAERAEENAQRALEIGLELYQRFLRVFSFVEDVGDSLTGAVDKYNQAIRSINSRLLPQAQKLQQHVMSTRSSEEMKLIEKSVEVASLPEPRLSLREPIA